MDLIQAMGAYATISIEQIGSYAGFAAVLGLAVLSALYFSQARDVKRLREWAGRAPERDAEARARVAAATAAGQQRQTGAAQPAAQPAPGAAVAQPAATNSGGGNSGGATATPAKAPAVAAAATASKAPAVGGTAAAATGAGATGAAATGTSRPNGPGGSRPSGATSILTPQDAPREPWYRRIAPRYIALIVAGVLVVGGGIAVGAIQLLSGDDSGSGGGQPAEQAANTERPANAPIRPGDVSVAVLNATPVQGLANQFGDRAQAEGFKKDNVGNAPGSQQRAESVVLFAPGKEREARFVRRRFNVSNIEPVDRESQALAPQADVILVVGADNTQ